VLFAHTSSYTSRESDTFFFISSSISETFGMDLHPGAKFGRGIMIDHATGIVVGETAVVDDDCSLFHGVTLGGTGKHAGDRHPTLGKRVTVGAHASVLGAITIGADSKIGKGLPHLPHSTD
jgi:serine O-acetyltransferase